MTYSKKRNQDRSIYYWLYGLLQPKGVTVVDGYPDSDLVLPTVSVEADSIYLYPFEHGNRENLRVQLWIIDIFASTKDQRDELEDLILGELEQGIEIYDYNSGFPSSTLIGKINPQEITATPDRVFPNLTDSERIYWRTRIRFTDQYINN